ncbi:ARM repeat-containing protein [Hygrophoropsis aurantiaca]|uniref:ARM repeat-containing protein n=1 Tax=Hygrophoropsis aurantiaca TaxID=72124 RepID=A0ACB8AP70_9AGAM|nr:ARM repeat-containing protein [Hygrophoropsis aurantiaca]
MGKSQKKRAMRRHNPMRVPDSHLPKGLQSVASSSKNEAILPIVQKMESPDGGERKWACVAVSNLIQNDPSTRRLLQGKNIVGSLITRLSDSEEEVWIEAAGALRNLCIDGGYDICAEMYNKNVLAPLKTFVPKISTALSQFLENPKTSSESAQKVVYEFADNVITILWCLSETSNKALNAINQMNLVPFLMSFLASRNKLPIVPVTAAAQCLYVLTDDNQPAIDDVRSNDAYINCLLDVVRTGVEVSNGKGKQVSDERINMFKVLVCGILGNVSPSSSGIEITKDITLPHLQPIISSISLLEIADTVKQLVTTQESEPMEIEKLSLKDAPKSDHKSQIESQLENLENRLRTIQLALEILTGACALLPDPVAALTGGDDDIDDSNEQDDTEMDDVLDDDMALDGKLSSEKSHTSPIEILPSLVTPLLALTQPTALSFPPPATASIHPPTTSVLSAIHISALECLNNIFLSLSASSIRDLKVDVASGRRIWEQLWGALGNVGIQIERGQEKKQEIWEVAVGVSWGIGNIWKGDFVPTEEQVNTLIQLCTGSIDSATRVKCIGTLECLAQHQNTIDANRIISLYLLSLLPIASNPSPVGTEPLLQVVSALIDIYSDENMPYDVNFREGRFEDRLADSIDGVKKAVRAIDKRKERDLRIRGEEIRDNLIAFVSYRRELGL